MARIEGEIATFGITWFAQDSSLGEIVFFDPFPVGRAVTKDQPYGEIESVKTVSDVYAPVSGGGHRDQHRARRRGGEHERRSVRRGDGRSGCGCPTRAKRICS